MLAALRASCQASKRSEDAARSVREKLAETTIKRERRFVELRSDIDEGRKLADEIDKHLNLHELNARTRNKKMFDEWNQRVYGGIQDQINSQLSAMDSNDISRRRRLEFQKFLDTTNAKGAIFRDIIIESEYDPLEPNRHCIKVDTSNIRDPVQRALDRHHEETSMLVGGAGGASRARRPKAHVKEMLSATLWGKGKIEATPHGYFAKLMDDTGGPAPERTSKTFASKIPMDHYSVATGPDSLAGEFPIGKRTTKVAASQIFD